jgi:lipopolysaccharide export system permease protein
MQGIKMVLRIKKLHKLILQSFLGPFVLTFLIVVFVLLMQFLWKYIDDLVGKGLDIPVITELLMYTSASLVPMALPLAVLLASIMTFGNLGEHNELVAFKSAGISLWTIMAPLIVTVSFITIGAFLFNNNLLPVTNLKMRSLLYDIQKQNPELQIKPGLFDNTIEGYSIRVESRDSRTGLLKGIQVYDHSDNLGNIIVTYADSGYIRMTKDERHLVFTLFNGNTYSEMQKKSHDRRKKTYPARRDKFEVEEMLIELVDFGLQRTDESLFKSSYQMMNLPQLKHMIDSLHSEIHVNQKELSQTLNSTAYYKNKNFLYKGVKRDSVVHEKKLIAFNPDSALYKTRREDQIRLLNQAIGAARNTTNYLNNSFVTQDNKVRRLRKYEIEAQRKYTLSLACLLFFFIGAPLGAIIRKGGLGMPVVVSVVFFILYYIISMTGEKFSRESVLSSFTGMWISTFLLIPLGAFLSYKASKDSTLLNIETYTNFFRKLFRIKHTEEK